MRLIDADALVKALQDDIEGLEEEFPNDKQVKAYKCGVEMALAYIGTEPTIDDVAPVRHGHWIFNQDEMSLHCSYCDEVFRFEDAEKDECLDFMEYAKYCLACGTRMDGEEND